MMIGMNNVMIVYKKIKKDDEWVKDGTDEVP